MAMNGTAIDVSATKLIATTSVDEARALVADLRLACAGRRTTPQHLRNVLPLPALLPWLGNTDMVDDICSLISFSLSDLDGEALAPYQPLIEQGLAGPIAQVRVVALEQARKLPLPQLSPSIWTTVGFDELNVAERASKLLEQYAQNPAISYSVFAPECLRVMEELFDRDSTVKYRLLDTVVRISGISDAAFRASMDTGIPARLTEELDFDGDLLGALAALELCAQLAVSTPGGLTFLDHLGIIERLAQGLEGAEALVVSNLVKFFGQIGTAMDKIAGVEQLFRAYSILERVQNLMDSPTGTLETSLFVFVENLGSTTRGLSLLKEQGQLVSSVLSDYRSASTEGRLVALHAISVLIEHCPPELASFAQQIYDDLGRTPLKDLVHLCRSAVEENRIAGYSVIKALTKHAWGLRALLSSPDVVGNWLFDRRTDTSRAGLEWKFSVVQGILVSPANAEGIVGPEMKARLQRYVNEGPFYMPTEAAVAFMSS